MTLYKGLRTWAFSFRGMHLSNRFRKISRPIHVALASFCMVFEREHYYKSLSHISYLWRRSLIRSDCFCLPTSNRSGSCCWSSRVLRWGFLKSKNTRFQTITKERCKWESPKKSAPSIKGLLKNARKYVQESKLEWQDAPNLSKFVYRTCSKKNGLNNHPRHPRSKGHSDPSLNVKDRVAR